MLKEQMEICFQNYQIILYNCIFAHKHMQGSRCCPTNVHRGYPEKEPILTAESGRTPALQPKKTNE